MARTRNARAGPMEQPFSVKLRQRYGQSSVSLREHILKQNPLTQNHVNSALAIGAVMASGMGLIGLSALEQHLAAPMPRKETRTAVKGVSLEKVAFDITKAYAGAVPSQPKNLSSVLLLKAASHARIEPSRAPISLPYFLMLVHENANVPKSEVSRLRARVRSGSVSLDDCTRLSALEFIHAPENRDVMKLVHTANRRDGASIKKSLKAMVARNVVASMPSKR